MEMTVSDVGGIRMYAVCLDDDSKLAFPGAGKTTLLVKMMSSLNLL